MRSMPEVPDPGENHGETRVIGRFDDFGIADRAPRLNDRRRAGLGRDQQAIRERKKCVGRNDRTLCQRTP